ncbi:permease-like cell division protein FtsX [Couchioplanes caeruleus]|uniref:permease-like cell division protein FtsX n=1 Tax=Couchioplanes caeruleus TaxID=56438 RepID=UPI0020C0BAE7|nr:permease-like cell division protein FtsX [Couchioplanes caeruleus]UQU64206.1 permease-like cell division protein FtsX [Couchioplanes caeruleus]
MDADLRQHFDRAVTDDPGADPGEMALAAIAEGARIRRRRRQVAGAGVAAGVVALLAVVGGVSLRSGATESAGPAMTIAAAMMPVAAPSCSEKPVESGASDVAIFLGAEATDRQRSALGAALRGDPRVAELQFENRQQAWERFRRLWADSPDFVAAVSPSQLPESYRLRMVDRSQYRGLLATYAAMDGVQDVVGRVCPASAPIGGVQ